MLQLRLLGEPALTDPAGRPLPLWRPELALLTVVACSGEGVRRDALAALLWPESDRKRARGALRQSLFRLRKRLGNVVRAKGEHLVLEPGRIQVDVLELNRALEDGDLERVAGLWGGSFLEGFFLEGNTEFDRWADGWRASLETRVEETVRSAVVAAEAAGDWPRALKWAEGLGALSPFSLEGGLRLARLRTLAGDAEGALAGLEALAARFRRELDAEPPPELDELADRIRLGRSPGERRTRSPSPQGRTSEHWPLVGREGEFREIGTAWARARKGRRQLVLLTGEPGIGKTRLAREFAHHAGLGGATVLEGRAYAVERGVPYAALAGILVGALHAPGLAALDGAALGELSRMVPSLARRFPSGVERPPRDLAGGRLRLTQAFRALLENLAYEAPLLLVLDDLPWADEATTAVLHYAWRTLPDHPVLFLVTARSQELDPGEPAHRFWTGALREDPGTAEEIRLGPLPLEAVEQLAGPHRDARVLRRRTGGNPFFLGELLREPGGKPGKGDTRDPESPRSLQVLVEERLRHLTEAEGRLLRAAAVLGRRFPLPTAAAVAGLDPRAGARAAGKLVERDLVREMGVGYDFVHDLVREIVREGIPASERRLLHRAAFHRLVTALSLPSESGDPGTKGPGPGRAGALARHAAEGGLRGEAFRWNLEAARQAEEIYAPGAAAGYLARARGIARSRGELLLVWTRTGELEWTRSRFPEAALAFLQAVRRARPGSDERLRLRLRLTESSLRSGLVEPSRLAAELASLLEEADGAGDPGLLRDAHMVAAVVRLAADHAPMALDETRRAVTAARAAGGGTLLVRALLLLARTAHQAGSRAQVLPALDEAVEIARGAGTSRELCDALSDRGTELSRLGRWDEAVQAWEHGLRTATEAVEPGAETVLRLNLSDLLARRGETEAAHAHLDRVEELCRRFHFPHVEAAVPVNRGLAAWLAGNLAGAVSHGTRAATWSPKAGDGDASKVPEDHRNEFFPAAARAGRSLVLLGLVAEGAEPEVVREALDELEGTLPAGHATWADDREITALARARAAEALGDAQRASLILAEAVTTAQDPFGRGLLLLEQARLRTRDSPEEAGAIRSRARELLDPLGLLTPPGAPAGAEPAADRSSGTRAPSPPEPGAGSTR